MSNLSNLKIVVDERFIIDYESAESLGIKFNRIVENFQDLSTRFGDYSYTFSIPITKNNRKAFDFADAHGRKGIFVGQSKSCRVYNNNKLILNGTIELRSINNNTYSMVLFSSFTTLLDSIGDKKLNELESMPVIPNFDYENDIISHLNSNHSDSNETSYQFPSIYYSTPWTPYSVLNNASNDFENVPFIIPDRTIQNWYYWFGSDNGSTTNQWYHHQFPMGIYIIPILESILEDAGWSLGGSFFEQEDIKKIIMLYTGDNDVYDRATGIVSGLTTTGITTSSFLPEMGQTEFIKGLINMFNLYFTLDHDNKIIKFDTYNTLFSDAYNPYNLDDKIMTETVSKSRIENYDPAIEFVTPSNTRVLGDNKVFSNNVELADNLTFEETEDKYTFKTFNKEGTTSTISLPFSMPIVTRHYLRNDLDVNGSNKTGGDHQIFLPTISTQTPNDNDNKPFYKRSGDTFVFNEESTIVHKGRPTLMYYYGQSTSDRQKIAGTDNKQFLYLGIGSTPTRTKMGFASPFIISQGSELDRVNSFLDDINADNRLARSKEATEVSYLKGNVYNLGTTGSTISDVPSVSLTMGESDEFHKTLWTEYHKKKYDLYFNSELLSCSMRMTDVDWNELQINRPILYNKEIYQLISIEYDPILGQANITILKK